MNDHLTDYTDEERAMFAALARSAPLDPGLESRIVAELHHAGMLRAPRKRWRSAAAMTLAAGLVALAWFGGVRHGEERARHASIEGLLARSDLSPAERVLLMQRAGSAYVEAANAYATSVARIDTAAVEVSSRVLIGAAQAVARTHLDGGMAPRLAALVRDSRREPVAVNPLIWY